MGKSPSKQQDDKLPESKAKVTEEQPSVSSKGTSSVDTDFVIVGKSNENDKDSESENETVSHVAVEKESETKQEDDENRLKDVVKEYDQIREKVNEYQQFKYKNGKLKINLLRATNMEDKDKGLNKN